MGRKNTFFSFPGRVVRPRLLIRLAKILCHTINKGERFFRLTRLRVLATKTGNQNQPLWSIRLGFEMVIYIRLSQIPSATRRLNSTFSTVISTFFILKTHKRLTRNIFWMNMEKQNYHQGNLAPNTQCFMADFCTRFTLDCSQWMISFSGCSTKT